jgi:tripeptide aminopeptidase
VENLEMHYLIRDHNKELFEKRKQFFMQCADFINQKYGAGTIRVELKDYYKNMKEKIEPLMYIVDIAKQAMQDLAIEPLIHPIRGGTDGSRLSFMGLPTPNIFTGGHNAHGKFEFIPVFAMEKAVEVIVKIIEIIANR